MCIRDRFYTSLDKVRFKRPVRPGDTVDLVCTITRARGPFRFATGTALSLIHIYDRVVRTLRETGNISSACIPLALDRLARCV